MEHAVPVRSGTSLGWMWRGALPRGWTCLRAAALTATMTFRRSQVGSLSLMLAMPVAGRETAMLYHLNL